MLETYVTKFVFAKSILGMTGISLNNQPRSTVTIVAMTILWLIAVGAFVTSITDHLARPGPVSEHQSNAWPTNERVRLNEDGFTLLMFVHPDCPCTQSSLAELERLLAQQSVRPINTHIILPVPNDAESTHKITNVFPRSLSLYPFQEKHILDKNAQLTRLFGIRTSGHCLLFDQSGQLLFSGGLTPLRGHEGSCPGNISLAECLHGQPPQTRQSPVFGCALYQGQPRFTQSDLNREGRR